MRTFIFQSCMDPERKVQKWATSIASPTWVLFKKILQKPSLCKRHLQHFTVFLTHGIVRKQCSPTKTVWPNWRVPGFFCCSSDASVVWLKSWVFSLFKGRAVHVGLTCTAQVASQDTKDGDTVTHYTMIKIYEYVYIYILCVRTHIWYMHMYI